MKKLKNNKVLKFVFGTIKALLIIVAILFILVVALQRFSNNKVAFFDYRIFAVVTDSMEPKYNVGDVLLSKDIEPEEVKEGDAISYLGTKYNFAGKIITHEVVSIEEDENGKLLFHTKGINNLVEDPVVHEDQLYGIVVHKFISLSFIYDCVSKPWGVYVFIILPIFFVIGSELIYSLIERDENRRNKAKAQK